MKRELQDKLIAACPILYGQAHIFTKFVFECGDGWWELLNDLSLKLEAYNNKRDSNYIVATQVKEKWGGLRFYIIGYCASDDENNEVYTLIDAAETKSLEVCEECGEPGKCTDSRWLRTLCPRCVVERGAVQREMWAKLLKETANK